MLFLLPFLCRGYADGDGDDGGGDDDDSIQLSSSIRVTNVFVFVVFSSNIQFIRFSEHGYYDADYYYVLVLRLLVFLCLVLAVIKAIYNMALLLSSLITSVSSTIMQS